MTYLECKGAVEFSTELLLEIIRS